MKPTTWIISTIAGLSFITQQPAFAQGESFCSVPVPNQVFCDDFSDGSATDGNPVGWRMMSGGTQSVQEASLVISRSAPGFPAIEVTPRVTYADVSMRTQVRLLEGDSVGLATRDSNGGVYGGFVQNGFAKIGEGGTGNTLAEAPVDLDPFTEDVLIQFDVFGSNLALWVWTTDDKMPTEPTVSITDDTLQSGSNFVWAAQIDPGVVNPSAAIRFVQLATSHIPEPSSAMLLLMGVVGLSQTSMRHRRAATN